jgi:hypothetical protein
MFIDPSSLITQLAPLGARCLFCRPKHFAPKGAFLSCAAAFYKHLTPNGVKSVALI